MHIYKNASMSSFICCDVVEKSKPAIMFYSNKTVQNIGSTVVVGLEGEDVSLRCFFSGRYNIHCALVISFRKDT